MLARDHVERDMIGIVNHHAVGADVHPVRIEIPRHDRTPGTDVSPAIQFVPEGCRKSQYIDIRAFLHILEHRSMFHGSRSILGCLRFPRARLAA